MAPFGGIGFALEGGFMSQTTYAWESNPLLVEAHRLYQKNFPNHTKNLFQLLIQWMAQNNPIELSAQNLNVYVEGLVQEYHAYKKRTAYLHDHNSEEYQRLREALDLDDQSFLKGELPSDSQRIISTVVSKKLNAHT